MKTKVYLFLLMIIFLATNSTTGQNIQIVSNFDWEIGTAQEGPFDGELFDVSFCVDESVIDSACGTFYGSPLLAEHFSGCEGMMPLWGATSPASCNFPAATYWFRYNFNLSSFDCINLESAVARVQADNSFSFYLNGTLIGGSAVSEWDELFTYSVIPQLEEGENEILVRVENLGGGTCFNYAFLAFCLDIGLTEECGTLESISLGNIYNSGASEVCLRDLETDMLPCATEYAWTVEYADMQGQTTLDTITSTNKLTLENINNGQAYTVNVTVQAACQFSETEIVENELQVDWNNEACMLVSTKPELEQYFNLEIFPNPASSIVYLNFDQEVDLETIRVMDSSGKIIHNTLPKQFSQQYSIEMHHWPNGIYFIQCIINGLELRKRLIKAN